MAEERKLGVQLFSQDTNLNILAILTLDNKKKSACVRVDK